MFEYHRKAVKRMGDRQLTRWPSATLQKMNARPAPRCAIKLGAGVVDAPPGHATHARNALPGLRGPKLNLGPRN